MALLNQQAATIEQLNHELKRDLQQTQEARVLSKAVSFEEFGTTYSDRDACLRYLAEIKWAAGFRCRKCGHEKSCEARESFAQRCIRCGYVESATAYTPLHRCKFDIVKALYCIFVVHTQQGNYSSLALSQTLQLRRATCSTSCKRYTPPYWPGSKRPATSKTKAGPTCCSKSTSPSGQPRSVPPGPMWRKWSSRRFRPAR